jgi:hypothetical protein
MNKEWQVLKPQKNQMEYRAVYLPFAYQERHVFVVAETNSLHCQMVAFLKVFTE